MKLSALGNYNLAPPVVQFRHEEWMRKDAPFSPEAVAFVAAELAKGDRDRTRSFSASGLGSCPRQQQFTWIGLRKLVMTGQRMAVMLNGKFVHLRLQAAGLTAGWLKAAEVPIGDNPTGLKGTIDGINYDDSVLEAKSINSRAYGFIKDAPKEGHVYQAETYLVTTGREKAVILYENKDTQDVKEHVIYRDDAVEKKIINRALDLQEETAAQRLFPMLPKCQEGKGWQFDYCDYKDRCPLIRSFNQAMKMAEKEQHE